MRQKSRRSATVEQDLPTKMRGQLVLWGAVILSVTLAAVAFLVGRGLRSPAQVAASARPPTPSLITAPVRISHTPFVLVLRGTVAIADDQAISGPASLDGALAVVTAVPAERDAIVNAGSAVLGVAGHPVIALSGTIPAYRSLAYGDSGPDVTELQSALTAIGLTTGDDQTGSYGIGTATAVSDLFRRNGYAPVTATATVRTAGGKRAVQQLATVPLGEVAFLRGLPRRVVSTEPLGATLKASTPAVTIGTGTATITIRVNSNEAALLKTGDRGRASSDLTAAAFAGRVTSIIQARTHGAPRYLVRFSPDDPAKAEALIGQNLEVKIALAAHRAAKIMVPDGAVVTQADGKSYVIVLRRGRQTPVPVRILTSYQGAEIVDPIGGRLRNGESVVIGSGS